jgi:hypothetical protein
LTKNSSIAILIFGALLIMYSPSAAFGQSRDTLVLNDESFDQIVTYSARDSIYNDVKKKQVHLYGEASVKTEDVSMKAGYILIDLGKNEMEARYAYDADSNRIEFPVFTDGAQEIKAATVRYNFDTKKGYIQELAIKQDELFLYMGVAKRQPNEEIHFKEGRFTTCDLEEPHYHFQLSRAIMIPEERIVTGPMNLWIAGVPTPLGLPFSVIPQQKERTHGILFPEIIPQSIYGFGVQNLGYYFPINQNLQTSAYINLYSRGSWGVRDVLDYSKRYGFSGSLDVGFQQFRSGFPSNDAQNKLSVSWNHRKLPKSNPYWDFNSNVNFISDNQSKNNLDPLNDQYFNNSFNSDVNMNRNFPGKPITTGLKLSVRQNSQTKNVALTSPQFNLNVSRVFPFKNVVRGTKGWQQAISRIGITYSFEGMNRATFRDSLLENFNAPAISNNFMNGFQQAMTIQTNAAIFKNTVKINPSINYSTKLNFQQIQKSYDAVSNKTITDTISKTGVANELSINVQATTMLYSYYKFVGKKKPLLRHIATPSVGFRYVPQLNTLVTDSVGVNQQPVTYSPFERSIYQSGSSKSAGLITFGVNNTFELKRMSAKDTVTGFSKTRIIDMLSINGSYDLMKDSMNLSDIDMNLRISPFEWINFVANTSFSPYAYDSTGKTVGIYALSNGQSLGRMLRTNLTTTLTITSKESRKKIEDNKQNVLENWNSDLNYYALHPEWIMDFTIPWKLSLSHVYGINANTAISALAPDKYTQVQTLVVNGDVSFTKRWKIGGNINFDVQNPRITNARITLSRSLHCWAMSFFWTPIGGNKSFLFSIRNTSSLLNAAKIEIRRPPVFL